MPIKKIIIEIMIITCIILTVLFGLEMVCDKDQISGHSLSFNVGDTYHVMSIYFVLFPLTFVLLSLFIFLRAALKKFQSNFLNRYSLTTTFISLLCFPMAFELHQSLSSASVGKTYNTYYLSLQFLYVLFVLKLIYISFQMGNNKGAVQSIK